MCTRELILPVLKEILIRDAIQNEFFSLVAMLHPLSTQLHKHTDMLKAVPEQITPEQVELNTDPYNKRPTAHGMSVVLVLVDCRKSFVHKNKI